MSTPITTLPPDNTTAAERNALAYPDYYDTVPMIGCGICSAGCLFKTPECYSCATENFQCCLSTKTVSCRPAPSGMEATVCICSRTECDVTTLQFRCKTFTQTCCSDCRCALPPEEQSPVIFNLLFVTIYFRDHWTFKFCAKASDL